MEVRGRNSLSSRLLLLMMGWEKEGKGGGVFQKQGLSFRERIIETVRVCGKTEST